MELEDICEAMSSASDDGASEHAEEQTASSSTQTWTRATDWLRHASANLAEIEQVYKWQWLWPKKGWDDMPEDLSNEIEKDYREGHSESRYRQLRVKKDNLHHDYVLTFETMMQKNLDSGRLRQVRRVKKKDLSS